VSKNIYKVKPSQWKKWGELRRHVFNETYADLLDQSVINSNPKTKKLDDAHWAIVAWNAAWLAAEKAEEFVWE
jgi:hypothetical protein